MSKKVWLTVLVVLAVLFVAVIVVSAVDMSAIAAHYMDQLASLDDMLGQTLAHCEGSTCGIG